jgi:hypothetical protein
MSATILRCRGFFGDFKAAKQPQQRPTARNTRETIGVLRLRRIIRKRTILLRSG